MRRRPFAALAAAAVVLLVATLAGAIGAVFLRPLPTIDGEYRLLGLEARAEALRDADGVPHLYAASAHDLFFLQGFVTAQDRLFQMDLYRRAGEGTLSEVLGPATLETDRLQRILGYARTAQAELAVISPETRAALDAYAEGVNKLIDQSRGALPVEFTLLGYSPRPWTAVDAIVISKAQAADVTGNYQHELARAAVVQRLGPEALAVLFPEPMSSASPAVLDDGGWAQVSGYLNGGDGVAGLEGLRAVLPGANEPAGSNCWALASRTKSGKPILAGDPHLAVRNPSIFYEVALEGAGYKVAGFSIPGLPGVVIGHTERVAWSLTVANVDVQDLFVELPDPKDPLRYQFRGSSEPATFVREEITVKGARDPVTLDVTITRHGPILTPVLRGQSAQLALRWTALDAGRTIDGLLALDRATDWASFRAAVALFDGTTFGACYADVDGHIAYQYMGGAPVRAKGDGRLPVPGWTGEYEWTGREPFERHPAFLDPPSGLIVTANDRPSADPASLGYLGEWDPGFRAQRLRELLQPIRGAGGAAPDTFREVQTDVTSVMTPRFREVLLGVAARSPASAAALSAIRGWDGVLSVDSQGAAIYEAWLQRMIERVFKDKLGETLYADWIGTGRPTYALWQLVQRPTDPWFVEVGDAAVRGREELAARALDDAVRDISERLGPDQSKWRWGDLHTVTFGHPLSAGLPAPLARAFDIGPVRRPGDGFTVNQGGYSTAQRFAVRTHASERMIVDLGDLDGSLAVIPTGESGQPFGRHWGDQTRLWDAGRLHAMRWSKDRLGPLEGTLVFRPR